MKFTALAFAAMATFGQAEQYERGLATLAEKWNISEPVFAYESLSFTLDYQVSDYIGKDMDMVQYIIYDQYCADGNPDNGDAVYQVGQSDETPNPPLADGTILYTSAAPPGTPNGIEFVLADDVDMAWSGGNGGEEMNQTISLNITLDADSISDNTYLYVEDDTPGAVTAEIRFCVRFSLWTPHNVPTPVEVNFLETIITLNVDLSDGFEIGSIAVEPKDRIVRTANQAYQVRAYQCDGFVELTPAQKAATQNQGAVIRVCVTPDAEATADGIKMRAIDNFSFTRDAIEQIAVANRAPALNLLTTYDNSACAGATVCAFETILFAAFYTSLGQVFGSGVASMQFGARRMLREEGSGREAQEEPAAAAEFELEFGVQPTEEVPSGASAVGALMGAVLAVAVAAM